MSPEVSSLQGHSPQPLSSHPPLRVLHVLGGLVRGGIETWLMHILRTISRDLIQMDFLVHTQEPCPYDAEAIALGSKIIACPHPREAGFWGYGHHFRQSLAHHGPYDIVHSHSHYYSGMVLRLAHQAKVPVRIAHSHIDISSHEAKAGLPRQLYLTLMKWWIRQYATLGLACSRVAAADLFGANWQADRRWQLLYYGINLDAFAEVSDRARVRTALGIPLDALVIGHIGRFAEQKNHQFLIDIAGEVVRREPHTYFLLVGEGELRSAIEQQVAQANLTKHVLFLGGRSDIPQLMLGAMDSFLFPSLYEGSPLVLIEAQAAGLPCLLSDTLAPEATVITSLMQRLSLTQSPAHWAEVLLAQHRSTHPPQGDCLAQIQASPFNINVSAEALQRFYRAQMTAIPPI